MSELPGLNEAAAKLQGQLAKSSISELRQTIAGLKAPPEGVNIETTTRGQGTHATITIARDGELSAVTVSLVPEATVVTLVKRTATGNSWTILSTEAEKKQMKTDLAEILKESPQLSPLLRGATYPDQTQAVQSQAPSQQPPKLER